VVENGFNIQYNSSILTGVPDAETKGGMTVNQEEIVFPSIVVDIGGELYSVNSSNISGIVQLQDYRTLPNTPEAVRGMFHYRDTAVVLIDMRAMMDVGSLATQYAEFCQMIDDRKQDHVRWVNALERTVHQREPFTLATDSHQCALGKWCDQFHSEIGEVNLQLNRLADPHAALHHSAVTILEVMRDGDDQQHQQKIDTIYQRVKTGYMPEVLSLLDEMKEIFRTSVFREMVLLLNGRETVGLIVDKVLSVEDLYPVSDASKMDSFLNLPYVNAIQRSKKIPGLILDLDVHCLLEQLGGLDELEQQLEKQSDM